MHDRASGKVAIGTGAEPLPVGFQRSVQNEKGVSGTVAVAQGPEAGRVSNEVVLGTATGILQQQPHPDRLIVNLDLRVVQVFTAKILEHDRIVG